METPRRGVYKSSRSSLTPFQVHTNMPQVFTHQFDSPQYKGTTTFNTGLFINGQFVDGSDKTHIEYALAGILSDVMTNDKPCSVVNPCKSSTIQVRCERHREGSRVALKPTGKLSPVFLKAQQKMSSSLSKPPRRLTRLLGASGPPDRSAASYFTSLQS